jgi:hypothetical protein
MNVNYRDLFDATMTQEPPSSLDLDALIAGARRRRQRRVAVAGAFVTVMVVAVGIVATPAGLGTSPRPSATSQPPVTGGPDATVPPATDPTGLLGTWGVTGTNDGTIGLSLGTGDFHVIDRCSRRIGEWRGNATGQFVAHISGYTGCDPKAPDWLPPWVAAATRFRVEADGWVLLNDDGRVLARMRSGWRPPPGVPVHSMYEDSETTARFRRASLNPAPLPTGLRPATRDTLIGRWTPAPARNAEAQLEVRADAEWTGTDGCNGAYGRWRAGPDGLVMATSGPTTLIGCLADPTPGSFAGARRAGFDGEVLILFDEKGFELGRLKRSPG